MSYDTDYLVRIIGNGSNDQGDRQLRRLSHYLAVARFKHPVTKQGKLACAQSVVAEADEFSEIINQSRRSDGSDIDMARADDEAFDVLVTALRWLNREFS